MKQFVNQNSALAKHGHGTGVSPLQRIHKKLSAQEDSIAYGIAWAVQGYRVGSAHNVVDVFVGGIIVIGCQVWRDLSQSLIAASARPSINERKLSCVVRKRLLPRCRTLVQFPFKLLMASVNAPGTPARLLTPSLPPPPAGSPP